MRDKIKILVADDHPVIRRGLVSVINSDLDLEVVGEASNGEIVIRQIQSNLPDIVILDFEMPVLDGFQTAEILISEFPKLKIVFLSMYKDEDLLERIARLDVMGYIVKDNALLEIVNCLKLVSKGKKFFSLSVSAHFNKKPISDNQKSAVLSKFTRTEIKVLKRISQSKTNREIAEELFVSVRTIENHRFKICRKLQLKGNYALLKFAIENKKVLMSSVF